MPRPPAFAREASKAAAPEPVGRRRAFASASYGSASQHPGEVRMTYVYILRSKDIPYRHDVGVTAVLRSRLRRHNAGEVPHTSKCLPWTIKAYVAFADEKQAFAFEKYLKSPSGRAFAKKRL
jgi:putative endonuclease